MAFPVLQEYEVRLNSGKKLRLYSKEDLSGLDILLRSTVSIRKTGRTGAGADDLPLFDGVPPVWGSNLPKQSE